MYKIALLKGDGIGPEIVSEAKKVLETIANVQGIKFEFSVSLLFFCAYDNY